MTKKLIFFLIFIVIIGSGCQTLPNVYKKIADVPFSDQPPEIIYGNQKLSADQSRSVIDKLQQQTGRSEILNRNLKVMEALSRESFTFGNEVSLLVDAEAAYAAIFEAVKKAKETINIETFILRDDIFGSQLAELLIKKHAEGVHVNIIYDKIGSIEAPDSFFNRLQNNGINVVSFGPFRKQLFKLGIDHRKILVVDGNVAITGGTNISGGYSQKAADRNFSKKVLPWRDTNIQIEGPAVTQIQKIFFDNWEKLSCPALTDADYFPVINKKGESLVQIITSSPHDSKAMTFIMYVSAITFAARSIHITAGYFVPDDQLLKALTNAAKRGVDVKIIVSSYTDVPAVLKAGHYDYSKLLKAGVKIYERDGVVLHAKTAIIDGVWSTVGTSNLDYWTYLNNDELNAVILDTQFAREMEKIFEEDIGNSKQIILNEWEKRPFSQKLGEFTPHLFKYWL